MQGFFVSRPVVCPGNTDRGTLGSVDPAKAETSRHTTRVEGYDASLNTNVLQ